VRRISCLSFMASDLFDATKAIMFFANACVHSRTSPLHGFFRALHFVRFLVGLL
jgi:hypothetical protein